MSDPAKKLRISAGMDAAVVNAPPGFLDLLGELPDGVNLTHDMDGSFDLILFFARSSSELDDNAGQLLASLNKDGILWIAFPKKASGVVTDLSRDQGWEAMQKAGMRPVSLVSLDVTWSALRFRKIVASSPQDQVDRQYSGAKASLIPIYERLLAGAMKLGDDVQVVPRKSYVALARGKQFAVIQASTNTRVDLGLKLPGREASGRLQEAGGFGSGSITHKVALASVEEVDEQVLAWLEEAYTGVT